MKAAVIQEFEISITAVGGEHYLVRTETVAKGVQLAEQKVRWPVADWLEKTQSLMHDPLLGLLKGQPRHTTSPVQTSEDGRQISVAEADEATLVHLGQALHDELFKGQLHDSWVTAQGVAQNRQDLLRLRIGMKDSRLQQLPWEALHAGTRPLATGTDVIFSRYILDRRQGHSAQSKPSESGQVLRILMVIASPNDQEQLELKQEVYHLQRELHPEDAAPYSTLDSALLDVHLTILEQPGRAELTQELDRGNYQVLHYAGHSNLGNAGGDLYLVSRQTGLTERLSGEDLAGLLVNNGIKLAVFNSCRGGYSASTEPGWQARNLAQALVNRGVPAVIAMTERIPDHVAITFTQLLYRNLKKGQSIDLSLNRTRQGLISAYGSHQFYWALPTLYMQPSFDGYLVKGLGDRENLRALDFANDPFGGMFSEPGLANVDLPAPRRAQPVDANAVETRDPVELSNLEIVNSVAKEQLASAAQVESERELRLSEAPKMPAVFYSEPPENWPENSPENWPENSPENWPENSQQTNLARLNADANVAAKSKEVLSKEVLSKEVLSKEVLMGKRLTRRHPPHPKFWMASSIAIAALATVLGVGWWQRDRSPALSTTTLPALSDISLPAQIGVAFEQNDLDTATAATAALIEQGDFSAAIAALQMAKPRQQQDVIVSFLRGCAQWGLAKQGSTDYSPDDARRSWIAALESESDWMEIAMALGFAQYAVGKDQAALTAWQQAIKLAERQPDARNLYFSKQPASEYVLNAYAGVAMVSLSLAKIEANAAERNRLLDQASAAYLKVIDQAPSDFNANALGKNWLWIGSAIADWNETKTELSQPL